MSQGFAKLPPFTPPLVENHFTTISLTLGAVRLRGKVTTYQLLVFI